MMGLSVNGQRKSRWQSAQTGTQTREVGRSLIG